MTAPCQSDLKELLAIARGALERIAAYGDPWEMADEPEEFGGTDDGKETVCMAYENMQGEARGALKALIAKENDRADW